MDAPEKSLHPANATTQFSRYPALPAGLLSVSDQPLKSLNDYSWPPDMGMRFIGEQTDCIGTMIFLTPTTQR